MFTPSTIVRLLQNVDISSDYNNTFSFTSLVEQSNFFIGKTKHTLTNFTYQRKEKTLKVQLNIETLYNVSYLMFQNSNFGSKWFYAFITDMKYVNDEVTEITFEIDVMQTWYFDLDIKNCYIEREHVSDDTIGKHTVDENLDIGTPKIRSYKTAISIESLTYVIASTVDITGEIVNGNEYSGVYSGLKFYASNDVGFINGFISFLDGLGKADAILSIFTMPRNLVSVGDGGEVLPSSDGYFETDGVTKNLSDLDGYVPRNKKLLCYPYNYLEVTDHKGGSKQYRYEYFSNGSLAEFFITGNVAPSPSVILIPSYYNGVFQNNEESMSLNDYPLCCWKSDVYANWLAQNQVSNALNVASSVLSLGVGVATMNPIASASGVLGVASSIGQFKDKSVLPPSAKGSSSGGGNVARGCQTFGFMQKTIRYEYAKKIDDYFHAYGYKINEVKTPNFRSRVNWNYIKMHECNIFGNIPNNDLKKIHTIFKNGITFWHNDNVGNYNRAN